MEIAARALVVICNDCAKMPGSNQQKLLLNTSVYLLRDIPNTSKDEEVLTTIRHGSLLTL